MNRNGIKTAILFILLLTTKEIYAQYDNYWAWAPYHAIDFNPQVPQYTLSNAFGNASSTICDSSGKLLLYTAGEAIYDRRGQPLPYTLKPGYKKPYVDQGIIIPKNKYEYYVFGMGPISSPGYRFLTYFIVDIRLNNGYGDLIGDYDSLRQGNFYALSAGFKKGGGYWLLTKTKDSFFAFPVDTNGIGQPVKSLMQENLVEPIVYNYNLAISHDSKFVITSHLFDFWGLKTYYSTVYGYNFDNFSGQFSNQQLIAKDSGVFNTAGYGGQLSRCAFSPDDSLLYVVYNRFLVNQTPYSAILQFQRFAPDVSASEQQFQLKDSLYFFSDLKTGPDGKTYISWNETNPDGTFKSTNLGRIEYPDKKGSSCDINLSWSACGCGNKTKPEFCYNGGFPLTISIFHKLKFTFTNLCGPTIFTAKADTLFKKFTWHIQDIAGNVLDSLSGNTIQYSFKIKGKYIVTLQGVSNAGYVKWYTDTITWFGKPHALFATPQDTFCQYTSIPFKDLSTADTMNGKTGQSWSWDFGEGDTSNSENPSHLFTKNGLLNVQLIYSNGFCQDTFSHKIFIQQAPKPGFTIQPPVGCTPLTVHILSKDSGLVKKYGYSSGNGATDSVANPVFTYTDPGRYTIVQTLLAPGGCITQDSAQVKVIPSVSASNKIDVSYATVDSGFVKIQWKPLAAAMHYMVYRYDDNDTATTELKIKTDNLSLSDKSVDPDHHVYSYYVLASDSCGNLSGRGRIGRTILLSGKNEDNLDARIYWNPYIDWQDGIKGYNIYIQNVAGIFELLGSTSNSGFIDPDFLDTQQYRKCYKVVAIANDTPYASSSNIFCVNQNPRIFIPNAFSPNTDSLNSIFLPVMPGMKEFNMSIYNRWGELVFSTSSSFGSWKGWDGTFKGGKAPEGVYIYMISAKGFNGENFFRNGNLLLMR